MTKPGLGYIRAWVIVLIIFSVAIIGGRASMSRQDKPPISLPTNTPSRDIYNNTPNIIPASAKSDTITGGRLLLRLDNFHSFSKMVLFDIDGGNQIYRPLIYLPSYFGSPAWSRDGKLAAVGCRGQVDASPYLCILDMNNTENLHFDDLASRKPIAGEIARLPLPDDCGVVNEDNRIEYSGILSASWSPKSDRIAVVCRKMITIENMKSVHSVVCIISMDKLPDCWKSDLSKEVERVSWSPNKDLLVVSTHTFSDSKIYLVTPDGERAEFLTNGSSAEWSPFGDGLALIAVKGKSSIDTPIKGIAIIDLANKQKRWVYVPDSSADWPGSVVFECDNPGFCRLTWSPNGKYISFLGVQTPPFNKYKLYKLDVETGEINILFDIYIFKSTSVEEPAWGP